MTDDAPAIHDSSPGSLAETAKPRSVVLWHSLPYWLLMLSQLPLFVIYTRSLWLRQPHYRFIPFLALVVVFLVWERWPGRLTSPTLQSPWRVIFLLLGVMGGIAATVFVNPWLAAFAFCSFLTAWLAGLRDSGSERSLLHVGLVAFLGLQLPLGFDVKLIQSLQRLSASCSSKILELFGQMHDMPGTVLIFPGEREYFVEEACSGVQSLFTLLFCAGAYSVWRRYSLGRIFLMLLAASGWAVLMNSLRILAIPMAEIHYGIDLVSGWKHEALGYAVLVLAILMLLSTDRLFSVLFTPLQLDEETVDAAGRMIGKLAFWKRRSNRPAAIRSASRQAWRSPAAIALWSLALVFVGVGFLQAADVRSMLFVSRRTSSFFSDVEVVRLVKEDLPVSVGPWKCQSFDSEDRTRSSELGEHSDTWTYQSARYASVVSLDQPFPGWHELSVCYTNQGWKVKSRSRREVLSLVDGQSWPYVEIVLQNDLGEFGYLLFSFFDATGEPFDAPDDWDSVTSLYHRFRNRLSSRLREKLFQSETYQVQLFVPSTRPIGDSELEEVHENYLLIREQLRARLLERKASSQREPSVGFSQDTLTPKTTTL